MPTFLMPPLALCTPSGNQAKEAHAANHPLPALPIELPYFTGETILDLPPIGLPLGHLPSPVQNVVNPGDAMPQGQQWAPPTIDQTMSVVSHGSGVPISSNGQFQHRDFHPGQQGVSVTPGNGLALESSGNFQRRDMRKAEEAISGPGLAANVQADQQNFTRPTKTYAPWRPIAVNVDAGAAHPGRIARGVVVRGHGIEPGRKTR